MLKEKFDARRGWCVTYPARLLYTNDHSVDAMRDDFQDCWVQIKYEVAIGMAVQEYDTAIIMAKNGHGVETSEVKNCENLGDVLRFSTESGKYYRFEILKPYLKEKRK